MLLSRLLFLLDECRRHVDYPSRTQAVRAVQRHKHEIRTGKRACRKCQHLGLMPHAYRCDVDGRDHWHFGHARHRQS